MDPKLLAGGLAALAVVFAFAWRMGRRSLAAYHRTRLAQLKRDLEEARKTPDPDDDAAVKTKLEAEERISAVFDALPDNPKE